MLSRKNSILFVLMLMTLTTFGQKYDDFSGLVSQGQVPDDFTKLSSAKYKEDFQSSTNKDLDRKFYIQTRFFIDNLLLSGQVIFNDPISNYVEDVAQYVLKDNPELFEQLRFYTVKSTTANAFSTDQGIIFVTTGLIAQLENEAQLAFVLSHEISHYTAKHVRKSYVQQELIESKQGKYTFKKYNETLRQMSIYNKENELEADKKGAALFLNTDYNKDEINTTFQVLLYSQLPFDDIKFDRDFFNVGDLKLPDSLFPEEIVPIDIAEDYDDDGHSHPNIATRMESADLLTQNNRGGDKTYVISQAIFENCRTLARYESINILLKDRAYGKALYEIFLLCRVSSQNKFLEISKVKALYGLAKYVNHSRASDILETIESVQGESYSVHYLLKKLTKEGLNTITYLHLLESKRKYPENEEIKRYFENFEIDFALHSDLEFEQYGSKDVEFVDSNYYDYALKNKLFDTPQLEKLIALQNDTIQEENQTIIFNKVKRKGPKLGIDTVIVVDPKYSDFGNKKYKKDKKSELKKVELSSLYTDQYDNLDIEVNILDTKMLDSSKVSHLNEMSLIFDWINEVMVHGDMNFIPSSADRMKSITEKYGTSHFLFSGIYAFKQRNFLGESMISMLLISTVYLAPIALLDVIVPHEYFQFVAFEVNAETNQLEYVNINEVNFNDSPKIIKHYVYNVLHQLNKQK